PPREKQLETVSENQPRYCKGSEGSPNLPYVGNNNFTGFFPKPRVLFIMKVVPPVVIWVPVNRGRTVDSIQGLLICVIGSDISLYIV
ncbi:hypothetical protein GOODEAATRI_007270, partial [Goodea atripinnis]